MHLMLFDEFQCTCLWNVNIMCCTTAWKIVRLCNQLPQCFVIVSTQCVQSRFCICNCQAHDETNKHSNQNSTIEKVFHSTNRQSTILSACNWVRQIDVQQKNKIGAPLRFVSQVSAVHARHIQLD